MTLDWTLCSIGLSMLNYMTAGFFLFIEILFKSKQDSSVYLDPSIFIFI